MDDILQLSVDEAEAGFLVEEFRPIWQEGGMRCHVPDCQRTDVVPTLRAFTRHWRKLHVAHVRLALCSECLDRPFADKSDLKRHFIKYHKWDASKTARELMLSSTSVVKNSHYIDPRASLPPRRLSPEREMARQAARCRRHNFEITTGVLTENLNNAVTISRDQSVECVPTTAGEERLVKVWRKSGIPVKE